MIRFNRLSLLLACGVLVAGCGGEPAIVPPVVEHVATTAKLADGTYEVQVRYSETTSGGPCLSDSLFKTTTYHGTDYICLKSMDGTVSADQLVVKTGAPEALYAIEDLRGTVSFDNGTMHIQLEQPEYPDGVHIQGYAPYRLNGTYQLADADLGAMTAQRTAATRATTQTQPAPMAAASHH